MIALFNSNTSWGGGEWWHFQFAQWLKRQNQPVVVFCTPGGELDRKCKEEGLPTQAIHIGNLSYLNGWKRHQLKAQFSNLGITHLIINGSSDLKLAGPVARQAKVTRVTYRRGLDKPVKQNRHNRWLLDQVVTDILCNTEATKRALLGNPPITNPAKARVIYNPIDTEQFQPSRNRPKSSKLILGAAGRLVEQKGFDLLLRALVQIEQQFPNIELRIAGTGLLEQALKGQVNTLGLQSVRLLGFVSNMPAFYQDLDVFVFPSRFEGFGFALAEAMACGLPAVAFKVSSNPELMKNQQSGYLVEAFDIEPFAQRLMDLLSNPEQRIRIGAFARKQVVERFSRAVIEAEWQRFLFNAYRIT